MIFGVLNRTYWIASRRLYRPVNEDQRRPFSAAEIGQLEAVDDDHFFPHSGDETQTTKQVSIHQTADSKFQAL